MAGLHAEFGQHSGHVAAGGLGRDVQLGGDLAVTEIIFKKVEHLHLALGQAEEAGAGG
jgi:hypothetical protein